jgi:hypothetical protein
MNGLLLIGDLQEQAVEGFSGDVSVDIEVIAELPGNCIQPRSGALY